MKRVILVFLLVDVMLARRRRGGQYRRRGIFFRPIR